MAQDKYIIGNGPAPAWCGRFLAPYKRMNGDTGYVLYGKFVDFELKKGDVLMLDDGKTKIGKRGNSEED